MNPAFCWTIASWTVPAAFPVARPIPSTRCANCVPSWARSRPLAWLVGADSLLGLSAWHEWEALFGLAHFVVAERPGSPLQGAVDGALGRALQGRWADNEQALFASPAGRILRLHHPLREESASTVRSQIATGGPWRALLPLPWPTMSLHTACTARPQREWRGRAIPV